MRKRWLGLALPLLLVGCSAAADLEQAKTGVGKFHQQLNAGKFIDIYAQSGPAMKQAITQDKLVPFLAAVHRKLGAAGASSLQGTNVNYTTGGQFISLTYDTKFATGEGVENFVFEVKDGATLLAGYHINSDALVLN